MCPSSFSPRPSSFILHPSSFILHPSSYRKAGFTLLELLVVIGILTLLMAIGMAAFRRVAQSMKEDAAASRLDTLLRQARNSALTSGAPAFVELDVSRPTPRAIPWAYRVVGQWHFEDLIAGRETTGALGKKALVVGAKLVDGKLGRGLRLGDAAGQFAGHVDCDADPDFDCEDGGYLEIYVYWERDIHSRQYIFRKKDSYALAVERGGILTGEAGAVTLREDNYRLPQWRWTKVALAWDRRSTRILVDDAVVSVGPGVLKMPIHDAPLLIGDEQASFHGLVDEAKVLAAMAGAPLDLAPGAKLVHNAQPWDAIFFGADGALDVRYHTAPITLDLVQGPKHRRILVTMLGLTQRSEVVNEQVEEDEDSGKPAAKTPPAPAPRVPLLPPPRKAGAVAPPVFTDEEPDAAGTPMKTPAGGKSPDGSEKKEDQP